MKVRTQLMAFGELVQSKMKEKIKRDIKYFSTTTDIWSSRTMESFMTITLQALTEDFNMINMTLEVEPLQRKHTGTYIMEKMSESFHNWVIPHFGCIGHTLLICTQKGYMYKHQ